MNIDWTALPGQVAAFVNDGAPVAEALLPQYAPVIQIGAKLLTAAANAEPTAVSLVNTIQSGNLPTPAELAQFSTDYEDAYQALHDDIAAQIAADGAAGGAAAGAAAKTT